jgi:hypothetical protein
MLARDRSGTLLDYALPLPESFREGERGASGLDAATRFRILRSWRIEPSKDFAKRIGVDEHGPNLHDAALL